MKTTPSVNAEQCFFIQ